MEKQSLHTRTQCAKNIKIRFEHWEQNIHIHLSIKRGTHFDNAHKWCLCFIFVSVHETWFHFGSTNLHIRWRWTWNQHCCIVRYTWKRLLCLWWSLICCYIKSCEHSSWAREATVALNTHLIEHSHTQTFIYSPLWLLTFGIFTHD